jgi:hypothetical protein
MYIYFALLEFAENSIYCRLCTVVGWLCGTPRKTILNAARQYWIRWWFSITLQHLLANRGITLMLEFEVKPYLETYVELRNCVLISSLNLNTSTSRRVVVSLIGYVGPDTRVCLQRRTGRTVITLLSIAVDDYKHLRFCADKIKVFVIHVWMKSGRNARTSASAFFIPFLSRSYFMKIKYLTEIIRSEATARVDMISHEDFEKF